MSRTLYDLGRLLGVISGAAACLTWLAAMSFPTAELTLSGLSLLVAFAMLSFAVVVVIAAAHGHAVVLLVMFFASFFPVGAYLLSVGHWIRWVGVFDLGFAIAAGLIWWHWRASRQAQGV